MSARGESLGPSSMIEVFMPRHARLDAAGVLHHVIHPKDLYVRGRRKKLVEARSVFCFFAVTELGTRLKDLTMRFAISGQAVGLAVGRGDSLQRRRDWSLPDEFLGFLGMSPLVFGIRMCSRYAFQRGAGPRPVPGPFVIPGGPCVAGDLPCSRPCRFPSCRRTPCE